MNKGTCRASTRVPSHLPDPFWKDEVFAKHLTTLELDEVHTASNDVVSKTSDWKAMTMTGISHCFAKTGREIPCVDCFDPKAVHVQWNLSARGCNFCEKIQKEFAIVPTRQEANSCCQLNVRNTNKHQSTSRHCDICMATLTPVLYRAFSASTSRRFGARLPPLLGRDSRRWWQHLESHKGAAASAGTAELRALQLSWEIHGEGRARRAEKWRAFGG